jgi:uncharacterized OsmC-like protein
MGPGGGYSPEDLFALAVLNCLIATYKAYCDKSKISFREVRGKALLTVDKIAANGGFSMTHIDITVKVAGASDPDLAKKTLETAIKDCAVSNSIKTGKTFHIDIS